MMYRVRFSGAVLIGTVDSVETPDSILAKFDELIADLSADSTRDAREAELAEEREAELAAEREAESSAEPHAEGDAEAGSEAGSEPEAKSEPDSKPERKDASEPEPEPEPKLEPEPHSEPELESESTPKSKQVQASVSAATSKLASAVKSKVAAKVKRKGPAPTTTKDAPPAKSKEAPASKAKDAPAAKSKAATSTTKSKPAPAAKRKATPTVKRKKTPAADQERVLEVSGLTKSFGETKAVDGIDLTVHAGTIFGIVGPNGAGKTTTLSMITGLLRPDAGTVVVHGQDVWSDPESAKLHMGVLPDRLRLFDRLTGSQFLYYAGVLRGLPAWTVRERMWELAKVLGLDEALGRLVADYSAGMVKKITLAAALIHSPRLLVLDEPFESVDPVSVVSIVDILARYVDSGGTVVLSSHSMDLIERMCDSVAIIVGGEVLASGTVEDVREGGSLEEKFIELAGGVTIPEGLEWLHSFSD